ncbi:helix-turn-helix domain-containing protein [Streptomyces tanashiensis]|uniref:helix-turn-helix domain-containing protein n=1 Tax=Streptomyces tanashiensis TaxID=67367 RepID=UPI0036EE7C43
MAALRSLSVSGRPTRRDLARRLRHVRQHHPEGPFTLERLSHVVGVSKRNLAQAESDAGANLSIETLIKIAHNLGIDRSAYFLDEQVFQQVNVELSVVRELAAKRVEAVALRSTHGRELPPDALTQLSELIAGITSLGRSANELLQEMPHSGEGDPGPDRHQR